MLYHREHRISIYTNVNTSFTIEFISKDSTKVLGHLHTWSYDVVNRIKATLALPYSERDEHAKLEVNGYTLEQAHEALYQEFISQTAK